MKGRWTSPAAVVSIGTRRAADLRPTFLQVSDVSDFGSTDDAAALLVPPGASVTSATDVVKDTHHYYVYGFTRRGVPGCLAAAARSGRVLIALTQAAALDLGGIELCSVVTSFKLE
jgi:hypothetical protein